MSGSGIAQIWEEDSTPLPESVINDREPEFQGWNAYDPKTQQWARIDQRGPRTTAAASGQGNTMSLVTWNVDSASRLSVARMKGVLEHFKSLDPAPDIIFLQEVSKNGLSTVLNDPWICDSWFSTEKDASVWRGHLFMSMTLLSRARFASDDGRSLGPVGPVWRIPFPSRFGRDALCCDVFVATEASQNAETTRVRLINVHLDSLKSIPSLRPRQVVLVSDLLRSAGRGLVAGDFNPLLKGDKTLVEDNSMVDVWATLHPDEPGFTWGLDGRGRPYPAARLDKVAVFGSLQAHEIQVMHPGTVEEEQPGPAGKGPSHDQEQPDDSEEDSDDDLAQAVYWSDHSGLRCKFSVI